MASCIKQVTDLYDTLSYSDKLFADFVLQHPSQLIHMSIDKAASQIGVAPSTIIATVKKLGYEGFRAFKIHLASELTNPTSESWEKSQPAILSGSEGSLYEKVVKANISALEESLGAIGTREMEQAVHILLGAKRVYFFGVGTSSILAYEAMDYLFRIGLQCVYFSDYHRQVVSIASIRPDDAAILITQSGVNKEILSISELLKQENIPSIGISNYTNTPFSKYVDVLLAPLQSLSVHHDNHFALRIPILCVIETLFYGLYDKLGKKAELAMEKNRKMVKYLAIN